MFSSIQPIVWKEMREIRAEVQSHRGGWPLALFWIVATGAMAGWHMGADFSTSERAVLATSSLAAFTTLFIVGDTFAGERERHTLETLLASPLPDGAILIGKVLSLALYGWANGLIVLVTGTVSSNIAQWTSGPHLPSVRLLALNMSLSFLLSTIISAVGVRISLRAPTAKIAQQQISTLFVLVYTAPLFTLSTLSPETRQRLLGAIHDFGPIRTLFLVAAALTTLTALLLLDALRRFQRERLITD